MAQNRFELDGGDISWLDALSSRAKAERGRPSLVDDARLQQRRALFAAALEDGWGLAGWELQQATTLEHVRNAILPISDRFRELEPFVRTSTIAADASTLRKLRLAVQKATAEGRDACQNERAAKDATAKVRNVCDQQKLLLKQIPKRKKSQKQQRENVTGELRSLECELVVRERRQAEATLHYREREEKIIGLTEKLRDAEANFCQSELLHFILSGRYALVPLNFANAMAGLPYMGWRQSMKRTQSKPRGVAETIRYQQFRIIRRAIAGATSECESIREALRRTLICSRGQRSGDDFHAYKELRDGWYFLSRAIEVTTRFSVQAKALPHRVIAAFIYFCLNRSALDDLRAEEFRLF